LPGQADKERLIEADDAEEKGVTGPAQACGSGVSERQHGLGPWLVTPAPGGPVPVPKEALEAAIAAPYRCPPSQLLQAQLDALSDLLLPLRVCDPNGVRAGSHHEAVHATMLKQAGPASAPPARGMDLLLTDTSENVCP
jgi:hypothetical protein